MPKFLSPLVGMHFHPPAKAVVPLLARGQALTLEPEPENPYDSNAIKVLVEPAEDDREFWSQLEVHLPGMGLDLDEVRAAPIFLGYIARTHNERVLDMMKSPGHAAKLEFSADGKPWVEVAQGEAQAQA